LRDEAIREAAAGTGDEALAAELLPLSIAFATRSVPMDGRTPWQRCLGGSESALVFAARALAARGHHVEVFTRCEQPGLYDEVTYHDMDQLDRVARLRRWDVFVSLRFPDLLQRPVRAGLRVLWCQDVLDTMPVRDWLVWGDLLVFVSQWHRRRTLERHPGLDALTDVVQNPVELSLVPPRQESEPPLLVHLSRPERGLALLLAAWPSIHARCPEARLLVARYRSFHEPAGGEVEAFCQQMDARVQATAGAEHSGHLSKPELYRLLSRAALMLYPARFDETSCIAAIEAQACGLPAVATTRGALPETFDPAAAVLLPDGPGLLPRFADRVVQLLHEPEQRAAMSAAGQARAQQHDAALIAQRWEAVFCRHLRRRADAYELPIRRSLARRGDGDAAGQPVEPRFEPAVARWQGWTSSLLDEICSRLQGFCSLALVGGEQLAGAISERTGAAVFPIQPGREELTAAAALDLGGLLCAPDRPAFLHWLAARVQPGGKLVHALPSAPGSVPGQRVSPTYHDICTWFGSDFDLGLTLEGEAQWGGEPARCWIAAYTVGSIPAEPDRPARKRLATRPRPTVSACLIVRDEAETLLTTLESIRCIADEIRILDTGSQDATLDLIRSFSQRCPQPLILRQAEWPDDFGLARDMSLEGAEGDWILWIDGDERLVNGERLRRLLQAEHFEAYAIAQHNHIFDRGSTQVEIPFRLFRNHRGYRFFGAVHEHPERELNVSIEPWIVAPDVQILHYGYLTEPVRRRKLLERNLRLLMKDFSAYPGRQLTDILYLRDTVNLGRFDQQAFGALQPRQLQALQVALQRFEERYLLARCRYYHLGREYYDRALALLGWGRQMVVKLGGEGAEEQRHMVRVPQDAMMLAMEAARQFLGGQP